MKNIFKDKRILIIYILVIILIGLGFTYAISNANISLGLTTGIVRIDEKAYGNTEFDASNLDLVPILDSEVETKEENVIKIDFTVGGASTNNNDNIIYDIALKDLEVNCDLLSPYVKWKLVKNGTKLSEGSLDYKFDTIDDNGRFLLTTIQQDLPKYNANQTGYDNYNFYMWISDSCQDSDISNCTNAIDQSNLMKKTLDGKIEVELYTESKKELTRNPASSATSSGCSSRYAVNYNLNGGTASTSEKKYVISGSAFGELPTPTKTSIVTFDTDGGSNITNVKNDSSTPKNKIKLLADTTNKQTINYNFLGWYLEKNYTTKVDATTIVKTDENVDLYAKWEDKKITLPTTSKDGYEFLGWYSDKNFKNKIGDIGDTYQIYSNTTIYAKWKSINYTLTYDSNGGSSCSPKIVANGSTYGSLCEPTKTGYSFGGWYTSLDGNTKVTSSTVASSDTTIYAHWTPNTYKLTFNENYQKDDMSNWSFQYQPRFSISYDSTTNMNTVSVAGASGWEILYLPIGTISGREYQLSFDYEVPTAYTALSGYSGVGYQILKSIDDTDNSANAITSGNIQTSATTSKATKTLTFTGTGSTVYFAFNFGMAADGVTTTLKLGNIRISSTVSKTYGETIGDLLSTSRPNHTFNGWYTSSSNGTKISSSTKVPAADTTYYAQWSTTAINVTFDGNKFSTNNQTLNGLTITYDINTSYLTLNGTQSASIVLMTFANQSFSSGEQYKITLDYISGTHTSSNGGCIATEIKKAGPADLSTRNNADVGYPDSGSRSNTLTVSSTAASEGSVLYVWLWSGNAANSNVFNNYTVKVNITKVQTKSYTYGSTYSTFVDNPTRLGYTFVGWYENVYRSYPLNYYSDKYSDLKNAYGTDQSKLYDHWIKYGTGEGRKVASYITTDSVNLNENTTFYAGWIDNIAPSEVTITYKGGSNTCSWKNNYNIALSATDYGSGVDKYQVDWNSDGVVDQEIASNSFVPTSGYSSCKIRFRAVDKAGNVGPWSSEQHIHMDTTAPSQTTVNLNGYTSNTINNGDVTITPSATDNVGIAKYQYSHDGSNWADWPTGTAGWTITWNGDWNFWIRAVDHAGNVGAASGMFTVIIDKPFSVTSPSVNATSLANAVSQANAGATITLLRNITDSAGGVNKSVTINFGNYTLTSTSRLTVNNNSAVTITGGTGGLKMTSSGSYLIQVDAGSRLTITGGVYSNPSTVLTNLGQTQIDAGTFTTTDANVVQNGNSSNNIGYLWINGGTFVANGNTNGSSAIRNFSDQRWPTATDGNYIHYCTENCSVHITGSATITANNGKDGVHNDTTSGNGKIHFPQAYSGTTTSASGYAASAANGTVAFNGSTLVASDSSKLRNNSTRVTFGSNAKCTVGSTTKLCKNW